MCLCVILTLVEQVHRITLCRILQSPVSVLRSLIVITILIGGFKFHQLIYLRKSLWSLLTTQVSQFLPPKGYFDIRGRPFPKVLFSLVLIFLIFDYKLLDLHMSSCKAILLFRECLYSPVIYILIDLRLRRCAMATNETRFPHHFYQLYQCVHSRILYWWVLMCCVWCYQKLGNFYIHLGPFRSLSQASSWVILLIVFRVVSHVRVGAPFAL